VGGSFGSPLQSQTNHLFDLIVADLAWGTRTELVTETSKPANIFITKRGHANILDFGLAKVMPVATRMAEAAAVSVQPTAIGTSS